MQVKLRTNYRVQVSKRVHVSRIVPSPSREIPVVLVNCVVFSSRRCDALHFLLMCNSRHRYLCAHFIVAGANLSLLPPRHRCYALLSSALSRLVRETRGNSYQPRQDGLW